jgi:NTE family protein
MTTRALVLGGGGPVGVAWESGLIAGFARAGVDLGQADYVLGTSAGAIVGARLQRTDDAAALADHVLARAPQPAAVVQPPSPELLEVLTLLGEAQTGRRNPAEVRRDMGVLALKAQVGPEAAFVEAIEQALGLADPRAWPARPFACAAVDLQDGGFQLWDEASGAELLSAVASSCAMPGFFPPVEVLGRRYFDGGMRSLTNADLAAGHDVVVLLAVQLPGQAEFVAAQLNEEVEDLQEGGATVVVVTPDAAAAQAMGPNPLDFSRMTAAARAGLAQAAEQAEVLKQFWG